MNLEQRAEHIPFEKLDIENLRALAIVKLQDTFISLTSDFEPEELKKVDCKRKRKRPLDRALSVLRFAQDLWEHVPEVQAYMVRTKHVGIMLAKKEQNAWTGVESRTAVYTEEISITREGVWRKRSFDTRWFAKKRKNGYPGVFMISGSPWFINSK